MKPTEKDFEKKVVSLLGRKKAKQYLKNPNRFLNKAILDVVNKIEKKIESKKPIYKHQKKQKKKIQKQIIAIRRLVSMAYPKEE